MQLKPCNMEIPIWHKAVLTVTEASALAGGLNVAIIRAEARKSMSGRGTLNAYMSGNKVCIPREPFLRWLEEQGRRHTVFNIAEAREEYSELKTVKKPRARNTKNILLLKKSS